MRRPTTPSQTIGPYLSLGTAWLDGGDVVGADEPGRSGSPAGCSTAPACSRSVTD